MRCQIDSSCLSAAAAEVVDNKNSILTHAAPLQHLPSMSLVKSKQRVADHGEVFTPAWMDEAMLDLVRDETERIDARFLEPACGSGNFIVQILKRKLSAVELKFGKSDF